MDIKLDLYKDRFCRNLDRTVVAPDFSLSVALCEETLNLVNIDMFEGGLASLSEETQTDLLINIVKNGFPYFKDLLKELFELTDEEIGKTKIEDVALCIKDIIFYSINKLKNIKTRKN